MNKGFFSIAFLLLAMPCLGQPQNSPAPPAEFAAWPPEQRVAFLKDKGFYGELADVLVANGTDAVPALVTVVKNGSSLQARLAAKVLCKMDQYVPASAVPLPEFKAQIEVPSLHIRARLNAASPVDGHRIGEEGLRALKWAARDSPNKTVRLAAQVCSGELHERLMALPLADLLALWEKQIKHCYHTDLCGGDDEIELMQQERALAGRAPKSLEAMAQMLQTHENGFLIIGALGVLEMADGWRVRVGRDDRAKKLIRVLSAKLAPGNSERLFPIGFLQIGSTRDHEMQMRREQLARLDKFSSLAPRFIPSIAAFLVYARSQGEQVPLFSIDPSLQPFVVYLSTTHPDFPSWEYTASSPDEEILQPRFEIKMRRILAEWRKFEEERH